MRIGLDHVVGGGVEDGRQRALCALGGQPVADVGHGADLALQAAVDEHRPGAHRHLHLAAVGTAQRARGLQRAALAHQALPLGPHRLADVFAYQREPAGGGVFAPQAVDLQVGVVDVDDAPLGIAAEQAQRRGVQHGGQLAALLAQLRHQCVELAGQLAAFVAAAHVEREPGVGRAAQGADAAQQRLQRPHHPACGQPHQPRTEQRHGHQLPQQRLARALQWRVGRLGRHDGAQRPPCRGHRRLRDDVVRSRHDLAGRLQQPRGVGVHHDHGFLVARFGHVVAGLAGLGLAQVAQHAGALQVQPGGDETEQPAVARAHRRQHQHGRQLRGTGRHRLADDGAAGLRRALEVAAAGDVEGPLERRIVGDRGAVRVDQRNGVEHRPQAAFRQEAPARLRVAKGLGTRLLRGARQHREVHAELVVQVGGGRVGEGLLLLGEQ